MWVFPGMEVLTPLSLDGLFHRIPTFEMDENWGYPHLWKAPCTGNQPLIFGRYLGDYMLISSDFPEIHLVLERPHLSL